MFTFLRFISGINSISDSLFFTDLATCSTMVDTGLTGSGLGGGVTKLTTSFGSTFVTAGVGRLPTKQLGQELTLLYLLFATVNAWWYA